MSAQSLLDAVRKAALSAIWSQGVKLARDGAVTLVSTTPAERVFRVKAPGQVIAPTVTLYLDENEWGCDCAGKSDPCSHVVAAAIGATQGASLKAAAPPDAKLVYRLAKRERLLTIGRFIVREGGGMGDRLVHSLATEMGRDGGILRGVTPTHEDLLIDRILGSPARDVVPLERLADVFAALSASAEVTFLGNPIRISGESIAPKAIVSDGPNGAFVLRVERDESITDVVALGIARCGDTLRALRETELSGDMLERLPLTRTFARDDRGELVAKVLPEIERKLVLTVATKRLPRADKEARPRITLDLSHHGHTLSVLPLLVYGDPPIARVDGDVVTLLGKKAPIRRPDDEREVVRRLRDDINLVPGRRVDLDGNEAVKFAERIREWQRKQAGGLEKSKDVGLRDAPLIPRVLLDGDTFEVLFEQEGGDDDSPHVAEGGAVIRAWRDGLSWVPLNDGGWAPLPAGWLAKHGDRVSDLLAARDSEKKLAPAALPDLGALCLALDIPRPLRLEKLAPLLDDFHGIAHAELPPGINATLRTYQQEGVDWLTFHRDAELGAILADDMGLGKTLQTICVLRGRVLVVCPKSVAYNWALELERFRPALSVGLYQGSKRELDPACDVTIVTYAVLRMDIAKLSEPLWDVVVLDEAQAIKNESSQTARAAFALRGRFRIALSGTPVENRLEELWSVMNFANPGLLGGRSNFQERYSLPISAGDQDAAVRLRSKIRPFVLRRLKKNVLTELPPRTESVRHVELSEDERAVYDAVRAAARKDVVERLARGDGVLAALEALLRLRQAACHPQLVPGQKATGSSKVEALMEALEALVSDGHKALVFSQWTSLLDLIEPHLKEANISFTRLDGSTRDRASVVGEFQDDNGPPVMLVSLKAGGTGLNLTAADHVFLLDPWWNPAVEDQAADRAHRLGQERPVMVYRLVAKDTVEERIFALQSRKRQLADVALGGASEGGSITKEELLALLD